MSSPPSTTPAPDQTVPDEAPVAPPVAGLLLGPLLRHVDTTSATVWVETAGRARVGVRAGGAQGHARTVTVAGHHYALVVVQGLAPATETQYVVDLDGTQVWPLPDDPRPAPVVRTLADVSGRVSGVSADASQEAPLDIVFGSCRVDRPQEPPFTRSLADDPEGVGVDALVALSLACQDGRRPPDLLLMLGDQVYADEGLAPHVRGRIAQKRGESEPQGEVADFEEYTWLYHDSWSDPEVRWLLSTAPSAMIFDDHDVRDDWNTSLPWREQMRDVPWWPERLVGAYTSYWLHQHLGNLTPQDLADDELWARVREVGVDGDAADVLRAFAQQADEEVDHRKPSVWSYSRELGRSRLVVIDTRSGRMLEQGDRLMLDDEEWRLVEELLTGDVDHLLVASSLPVLLEPALHDVEAWNAATASRAAWGRRFAPIAETLRQGVDLEHWAAFEVSFTRLVDRLGAVAAGRHGREPGSVLLLSGDVHHGYVAPLRFPVGAGVRSPVVQLVSSPLRNALPPNLRRAFHVLHTPLARRVGALLRRSVGLEPLAVSWRETRGPLFGNGFASLCLDGRSARVVFEKAEPGRGEGSEVRSATDVRLRRDHVQVLS